MALLVTGNWYEATFYNTNNAAWAALGVRPAIPFGLIDAIVNGTSTLIYVTSSVTGTFAFEAGTATAFDDTLLTVAPAALASFSFTDTNAVSTEYCQTAGGDIYMYDTSSGLVKKYDAAEVALFKAWMP